MRQRDALPNRGHHSYRGTRAGDVQRSNETGANRMSHRPPHGGPRRIAALAVLLALTTCTEDKGPFAPGKHWLTPTGQVSANPPVLLVGAGDIAGCSTTGDELTASLLDSIPGTVFNTGDNVYEYATSTEYANCYHPTWGRHKARTKPAPGNHEYNTPNATGYFDYFGSAAGEPGKGYYSYDLGDWHIIVLNSSGGTAGTNISMAEGSAQEQWLRADLAANPKLCTLAYWHHPLYASTGGTGTGGVTYSKVRPAWDDLYNAGVDLIVNGHRHIYERQAPQKPDRTADPVYGIRSIIVGTGGRDHDDATNVTPNSEVRNGDTYGVLKLWLYADSYAWKFVPVAGKTFSDSGSTACHGAPGSGPVVSAAQSTVAAAPAALTAGSWSATITITVKDASGNPISGATVVLAATGSGNTLTQPSGPTNASGVATGTLSATVAEAKTVSATINDTAVTQTAIVTAEAVSAEQSTVTTSPTSLIAGSGDATITVTVKDASGNPVSGATVVLAATGTGNTLTQPAAPTDASGLATGTLSSSVAQSKTVSATANGVAIVHAASVTVTPGPVSPSQSTVTATPTSITIGTDASTITVTAKDANGNAISGATVELAATGTENTLTQPADPTSASGTATGTLSSNAPEAKTVSATINGSAVMQTATVTVAATADLSVTKTDGVTSVDHGGTVTYTLVVSNAGPSAVSGATVTDGFPAQLSGVTWTCSASAGSACPASGTGDIATAAVDLLSGGTVTFTASGTVSGTGTLSNTATVTAPAGVIDAAGNNSATDATTVMVAGITHTLLTAGNNTVNQVIYTTAAISPAPNTLVTVAVMGHQGSSATPSPTVSGGGMAAWTEVATITFDDLGLPHKRLTIYRAMSASPGSGPLTIRFSTNVGHCQWIVSQWDGVDLSGVNGAGAIGQIGTSRGNAVSGLTVPLAPFSEVNNVAYGVFGVRSQVLAVTPGAGFTEISEQPSPPPEFPPSNLEALWATNLNTITALWNKLNGGGLGVEIKARTTGP